MLENKIWNIDIDITKWNACFSPFCTISVSTNFRCVFDPIELFFYIQNGVYTLLFQIITACLFQSTSNSLHYLCSLRLCHASWPLLPISSTQIVFLYSPVSLTLIFPAPSFCLSFFLPMIISSAWVFPILLSSPDRPTLSISRISR